MARTKGSRNKSGMASQPASLLPPEERISFLAAIIAEQIAADQDSDRSLLKELGAD